VGGIWAKYPTSTKKRIIRGNPGHSPRHSSTIRTFRDKNGKEFTGTVTKINGYYEIVIKNTIGEIQDWDISIPKHTTRTDAEYALDDWLEYEFMPIHEKAIIKAKTAFETLSYLY
jgi:hypothetical protein